MSLVDVPPEVTQHAPAAIGSLTAALFMRGTPWPIRLALVIPGFAAAYYASPPVANWSGMPEGVAGLLLGLFAMRAVMKVFEAIESVPIGRLLNKWLAKRLGVEPEESDE